VFYELGADFLENAIRMPGQLRCYFSVTETGQPIKVQKTIFSETFFTIGMSEMYRATGEIKYLVGEIAYPTLRNKSVYN